MSGKSKINVFNKMTKTALDEEISTYVAYHRYYQRLIAVKIVSEGNTIADAANILGKSYQTVHRWIKTCESKGLEGLKPSFGGGRPSKLTYDQLIELDKIIEKTPNMSMKDVHLLVNEKFNVDYSLKQIGKIVRKLGYNYSKAYPKFSKSPEDAEEQLKKNLEEHNISSNNIMVFFDEASFQNEPYTQKSLYKRGTKHTQTVNPLQIQNQCHRIIINKWKINHHKHKFFNSTRNSNSTPRIKMY